MLFMVVIRMIFLDENRITGNRGCLMIQDVGRGGCVPRECTIRVTVLLEYLNCIFSMCGCLLFCNLLIFDLVLLFFFSLRGIICYA